MARVDVFDVTMISFQTLSLLLIATIMHVRITSPQSLSSTLLEGDRACPGARVNFTCTTSGSLAMAWRSDEYIGPNGAQLEFISTDGVGSRMTSPINPNTFATLIRINGTRVIESALTLIASDSIQTASVICSEVGQGDSTITFTLLAIPGIPQNVTANMIAMTSGDCVILLRWMPPSITESGSSIEHYIIDSPSGIVTTRDTSLVITLLIHHCSNDTYIGIHATDYCGRNGPSTNDTLGRLLIVLSDSTTQPITVTPTTDNGGTNQCSNQVLVIVSGTLGSLLFIGILILVALSIALTVIQRKIGYFRERDWEYHKLDEEQGHQPVNAKASDETNPRPDKDKKSKLDRKDYVVVKSEHLKKNIGERRPSATVRIAFDSDSTIL